MIIAIDGPAGTGKTTVARRVAECLHFSYFDTGAMYRAVTWWFLENQTNLENDLELEDALERFSFRIQEEGKEKRYFVDEQEVTAEIRAQKITSAVSKVSALPIVRRNLWKIQRDFGQKGDAVFEGRDIGTVVFPHAEIKIFLTARPEVRAQRRLAEIEAKKSPDRGAMNHEQMLSEIMRRDAHDSGRAIAPLKQAQDAYLIDTSDLSIDEVVSEILKYKMSKIP